MSTSLPRSGEFTARYLLVLGRDGLDPGQTRSRRVRPRSHPKGQTLGQGQGAPPYGDARPGRPLYPPAVSVARNGTFNCEQLRLLGVASKEGDSWQQLYGHVPAHGDRHRRPQRKLLELCICDFVTYQLIQQQWAEWWYGAAGVRARNDSFPVRSSPTTSMLRTATTEFTVPSLLPPPLQRQSTWAPHYVLARIDSPKGLNPVRPRSQTRVKGFRKTRLDPPISGTGCV